MRRRELLQFGGGALIPATLLAQDFEGTLREVAEFGSLDQVKRNIEYINAASRLHQSC